MLEHGLDQQHKLLVPRQRRSRRSRAQYRVKPRQLSPPASVLNHAGAQQHLPVVPDNIGNHALHQCRINAEGLERMGSSARLVTSAVMNFVRRHARNETRPQSLGTAVKTYFLDTLSHHTNMKIQVEMPLRSEERRVGK